MRNRGKNREKHEEPGGGQGETLEDSMINREEPASIIP